MKNDEKLLRPAEVCELLGGIGMSTLYEWIKKPNFPDKYKIGEQAVVFKKSEILDWLETRRESKAV